MSIQSNFPAIKPTLLLDFANTKQLDPRITFTRASTATYYGTQTAKAEENLLLQSQTFETTWAPLNTSITANTSVAPDGTTTADTLADNTTTGTHILNQSPAFIAGAVYTMSVFMKAGTNNFGVLTLTHATTAQSGITAVVDLSAGTISQTDTGTSATFTSSSITPAGNGWYRVVITGSSVAGFNRAEIALAPAGTGNTFSNTQRISYTGTGTTILIWGAQLEQRSAVTAYTATTTQAITNYIPVLMTAASGVARFEHNPVTGESLGLEIEEQRTNLLLQSETFATTWSSAASTVTSNTVVAPDGALTGDKLVEDTTTAGHFVTQSFAGFTSGAQYTSSVYVKAGERTSFQLLMTSAAFGANVIGAFDLVNGVTTSSGGTNRSSSITPVGNGWYRCVLSAQATATALASVQIRLSDSYSASSPSSYAGNGYSGIYIWGAQLEAGAFATSYIPTVASQVTRAADAASMTGTNFSSWYNQSEGTFFAQFVPASSSFGINRTLFLSSDGTVNNYAGFRYTDSGSRPTLSVVAANTTQAAMPTGTMVAGTSSKMAGAYKVNDFATSRDAGTVGTDTSGTVPVVTQAEIGMLAGTSVGTQTISKLAYYPLRMTNAQLQAMTTV